MRWRYPEIDDPATARQRRAVADCIDRWWDTFARHADAIDAHFERKGDVDLPAVMDALAAIDPALMWEFGPGLAAPGHRLCITPEGRANLRPLLDVVLERAPAVPRWEFFPYRLAEAPDEFRGFVDGRTPVRAGGVTATVTPGRANTVAVRFHLPATTAWPGDDEAAKFAFYTAERLLGEERLDRRVGLIRATAEPPPAEAVPLRLLSAAVSTEVARQRHLLPPTPRFRHVPEVWSSLKVNHVPRRDDYPAQSDLFVAVSPEPELFQAAHAGRGFYSERFSRCGETFCYLKLDGEHGLDPAHFADRGAVEDALTAALSAAGLGCTLGGGTGHRYSYVELAVTDVVAAMGVIRGALRAGHVHRRSWLLFHDADLEQEWLGVYPDTPAPPSA